jgi:asparagine synthase (glutamine-hydrolysing)
MCGICGATQDVDGRLVAAMTACMVHRGPDDDGTFVDGRGIALGARRLSIIDVECGHQPLCDEDGVVWAVLNGEIYNYPALRQRLEARGHRFSTHCDTEVLVHLYQDHGPALVHALDGMFAFAVWDSREQRLLLARDRFGEKPLFVSERDGELAFASELTALEQATGRVELDAAAIDAYMVLGYFPGARTIGRGVEQLLPGHLMTWSRASGSKVERYWSMPERPATDVRTDAELASEVHALLRSAVESRLVADVPVGVFLSGGIDSTLVTALAAQQVGDQLKTFTVGYDTGTVSESAPAAAAAAALKTEHHHLELTSDQVAERLPRVLGALDQPNADPALIALNAVSALAREHVTVAVGGEGADELFGGYPRYRWLDRAGEIERRVPDRLARATATGLRRAGATSRVRRLVDVIDPVGGVERQIDWVTEGRRHIRHQIYGERLLGLAGSTTAVDDARVIYGDPPNGNIAGALMRLDQQRYLPDDVLAKADRASMLESLEVRTPFLERTLAEFSASIPLPRLLRGKGKALLRDLLREVAPEAVGKRPKTAFRVPVAQWLRGPLAGSLREQSQSGAIVQDGWLDGSAYRDLAQAHIRGERDNSATLWPAYALGLWLGRRDGSA